mgnify:CR=1 FL=1
MKTYIKFLVYLFLKSFLQVMFVAFSLVIILNLLTELDFFKGIMVSSYFPFFLSLLNAPTLVFEMFPFIFLLSTQFFFINILNNNQINIFKYSGLKNSRILAIISLSSFILGILIITLFYSLSSNLKNIYLELKSNYTNDGKYLAVITKNGLWIKDKIEKKIIITNSSSIEKEFLIKNFITEFDENFNVIRNIESEKIDISKQNWIIINPKIYQKNNYRSEDKIFLQTNFDLNRIKTLYSNLSALNLFELYELRNNYLKLNYSITELELHLSKIASYPIFLVLISIFTSLIMLRIKQFKSSTLKISAGLFFAVIIYYLNNFSYVLGSTEKISITLSIVAPLLILTIVNSLMLYRINEK